MLLGLSPLAAQEVINSEGFETDGEGSRYNGSFTFGSATRFERAISGEPELSGFTDIEGTSVFLLTDVNEANSATNPTDPEGILVLDPVDISDFRDITISFKVAATGDQEVSEDYLLLDYALDADINTTYTLFKSFQTNGSGDLEDDTNLDLLANDGGTALGSAMLSFSFSLPTDADAIQLRIRGSNTVAAERFIIDSLTISGINYPELQSVFPANGASSISPNAETLKLFFDEPVTYGTGSIVLQQDDGTSLLNGTFVVGGPQMAGDNTNCITIDLSGVSLVPGLVYEIDVPAGAFQDTDGNNTFAIVGDTDWKFTVSNVVEIISVAPEHLTDTVAGLDNLQLTFDEVVTAGTGALTVFDSNGTPVVTKDIIADAADFTGLGTSATITVQIGTVLTDATDYYVDVAEGMFTGNGSAEPSEPLSGQLSWSFTADGAVPSGYTATFNEAAADAANFNAISFDFSGAEIGTTYNYTISDGSNPDLTGTGTVISATQTISGIDLSSLDDGLIDLSFTLTDAAGNVGTAATDQIAKDVLIPTGYTVSWDQAQINAGNQTAGSFSFTGAEPGTNYAYTITTSGGAATLADMGVIASAGQTIGPLALNTLQDGILTLSVILTDAVGNAGAAAEATISKDVIAPSGFTVGIDQAFINAGNEDQLSFTFAGAEVPDATYDYSISSSGGGVAVTGSGTLTTAAEQVTAIDVSTLGDGTLTLSVTTTDSLGNESTAQTSTVSKDVLIPAGYSVSFSPTVVNQANATSIAFQINSAEAGGSFTYSITSDGGGAAVNGSGNTTAVSQSVTGIDVSGLGDGQLTLAFTFTDSAGNAGSVANATIAKDAVVPAGYTVSWDQASATAGNETALSFTFAGAEPGTDYAYTITSDGGAGTVSSAGTIVTATDQITPINVSSLADGNLTLSVTLTDAAANEGVAATSPIFKDTNAPAAFTVSIDQPFINAANEDQLSFTFAGAEVPGATFEYTISSSGGGVAVSASGAITTVADQLTFIDVSGLGDGTLTLSVTLTDSVGNESTAQTDVVTKDIVEPSGYTVAFDPAVVNVANEASISFMLSLGEVDAGYSFSITSDGGPGTVNGSGTTTTANQTIGGIDVSGLPDGELSLAFTLTDSAGNAGLPVGATVDKDATAPAGFTPQILVSFINDANQSTVPLRVSAAEVSSSYAIMLSSSGGGSPVNLSGTVLSSTLNLPSVNLSGLNDGTVTMSVTLTDQAGNASTAVTTTVTKDATLPTGYSAAFTVPFINIANEGNLTLNYTGVEPDGQFVFELEDAGGATFDNIGSPIPTTASTSALPGFNLSAFDEGLVTIRFTFTDSAGNAGATSVGTIVKDAVEPSGYAIAFDPAFVNIGNQASVDLSLTNAEVTSSYSYTITSSGGGTTVSGGPTVAAATTEAITGLDLSGLADGTLTVSLTMTDTASNTGLAVTGTVTKDTQAPAGYTATWDNDFAIATTVTNQSFTINGIEVFSTGAYSITDPAGNGPITGGGSVGPSTFGTVSGQDLSALDDGELFLSITFTDTAGNQGIEVRDNLFKDTVFPTILSLDRASANPNNTSSVDYTLQLSEPMQTATVLLADFNLTGAAATGATVSNVAVLNDSTFTVTISNVTATGVLTLNYADSDNLLDSAGNALAGASDGSFIGQSYDIILPEPDNQVSGFTSGGSDNSTVILNWTEPVSGVLPTGYLLLAVESGNVFTDPIDGTDSPTSLDLSDGQAELRVLSPVNTSNFSGLSSGLSYDFRIYAFSNVGGIIDYRLTSPPQVTASTTTASSNALQEGGTASASISSLTTASPGVAAFDFTVIDDGASKGVDNAATKIQSMVIRQGVGNEITDWTQAIAGAQLSRYDPLTDTRSETQVVDITIDATQLSITNINNNTGELGFTTDDDTTVYRLDIWLLDPLLGSLPNTIDSLNFVFELDVLDITLGNTGGTSSAFALSQSVNSGATGNEVNVEATELVFETEPGPLTLGVGNTFSTSPVVRAQDALGNLDRSFDGPALVTVSNAAAVAMTDAPTSASLGRVNFATSFAYDDDGNGDGTLTVADDAAVRSAATSTAVSISYSDNTVLSAGVQASSSSLSTTSAGNFVFAFDFTLTDDAAGVTINDGVPTIIESLTISQGGFNEITDWTQAIDSVYLVDDEGNAALGGSLSANQISFSSIPASVSNQLGVITDDQDKVYSLFIRLRTSMGGSLPDLIDNLQFDFEVDDAGITTAAAGSSQLAAVTPISSGDNRNIVTVEASGFTFVTQPPATAFALADLSQSPVVRAQDDFGNLDTDFNATLEITNADGIGMTNLLLSPVAGMLTFSNTFQYIDRGDGTLRVTDQAGTLDTTFSQPVTVLYGSNSDIIRNASFSYTSNIDYISNTQSDVTATTGVPIEGFTLRDGGGAPDADGLGTTLSSLELSITNHTNLQRVALYRGATELAEVPAVAVVTFSGLSLSANDDSNQDFTIRATFAATVTDNEVIELTITQATTNPSLSSEFTSTNAGGATSSVAGDENRIEVTASQLVFDVAPVNISIDQNFPAALQLSARDANDLLDADFNFDLSAIVIADGAVNPMQTINTPVASAPSPDSFTGGLFTFNPNFQFTNIGGNDVTIALTAGGLTATSIPITVSSDALSFISLNTFGDDVNYLPALRSTEAISQANTALLAQFYIRDGGFNATGNDNDGAPTEVAQLQFDLQNPGILDSVGLFVGGVLQQSLPAAATLDFDALSLIATDDDSLFFDIRVSYDSVVTDNLSNRLTLLSAVNGGGSLFAEPDARSGTDATTVAQMPEGTGKVEVVASQYAVVQSDLAVRSTTVGVNTPFTVLPIFEAQDAVANLDLDYNQPITLVNAGSLPMVNVPTTFSSGILTLTSLQYQTNGDGTLTLSEGGATGIADFQTAFIDVLQTIVTAFPQENLISDSLRSGFLGAHLLGFSLELQGGPRVDTTVLSELTVDFGTDVEGIIKSLNVFSSADQTFSADDTRLLLPVEVSGPGSSVTLSGLTDLLEEGISYNYFIVAEISTFADSNSPTIVPTIPLANYTLSDGNAQGEIPSEDYVIIDLTSPSIEALWPANNAVNIPIRPDSLVIDFDEPVISLDSLLEIFTVEGETSVGTASLTNATESNTRLIFELDFPELEGDTEYYINVLPGNQDLAEGIFDDSEENLFNGITDQSTWRFRTSDVIPPEFVPGQQQVEAALDITATVRFQIDEPGLMYYLVTEAGQPLPDSAQIRAETVYPGIVEERGTIEVLFGSVDHFLTLTNLTPSTNYEVYLIAEDISVPPNQMTNAAIATISLSTTGALPTADGVRILAPELELCEGDFQRALEPITIIETEANDFTPGVNQTINLLLPSGYTFNTEGNEADTVIGIGDDITDVSFRYLTNSLLEIQFSISGATGRDILTISNLEIDVDAAIAAQVDQAIFRLGGSAGIDGLTDLDRELGTLRLRSIGTPGILRGDGVPTFSVNDNLEGGRLDLITQLPTGLSRDDVTINYTGQNVTNAASDVVDAIFVVNEGLLGEFDVTVTIEDQQGCIAATTQTITVFDNDAAIVGLLSNYCSDIGTISINRTVDDELGLEQDGFRLESLSLELLPGQSEDFLANLTSINSEFRFEVTEAMEGETFTFNALYRNNINPAITEEREQDVLINAVPNPSFAFENPADFGTNQFCNEGDRVPITIVDNGTATSTLLFTINREVSGFDRTGTSILIDVPTNSSESQVDTLRYVFVTGAGCSASGEELLVINPKPVVAISTDGTCSDTPITFLPEVEIVTEADVASWDWNIDDLPFTEARPVIDFPEATNVEASLMVTTDLNCRSEEQVFNFAVGSTPNVTIAWDRYCEGEDTEFTATVEGAIVENAVWDWGDGEDTVLTGGVVDASHMFIESNRTYPVTLTTSSGANSCVGFDSVQVFILEEFNEGNSNRPGSADTLYFSDFNESRDGWFTATIDSDPDMDIPESGASWQWGTPANVVIREAFPDGLPNPRAWVTDLDGSYAPEEQSWVYSPCFDLAALDRPMLGFRLQFELGSGDGVVFQYQLFEGGEDGEEAAWVTLGDFDGTTSTGISWYNQLSLPGSPGDLGNGTNASNTGWSGESDILTEGAPTEWLDVRHDLDMVRGEKVRFRFALGTASTEPDQVREGFAFDDFFVGNRRRNVLVEQFTTTFGEDNSPSGRASDSIRTLSSPDLISLFYHLDILGIDPFNLDNTLDPGGRRARYGVSTVPFTVIDGGATDIEGYSFSGNSLNAANALTWTEEEVRIRALTDPAVVFDEQLETSIADGVLSFDLNFDLATDVDPSSRLFVAIVEKSITLQELADVLDNFNLNQIAGNQDQWDNIMINMLPDAGGIDLNLADARVERLEMPFTYQINNRGYYNELSVIAWVQDNSNEVLQAVEYPIEDFNGEVILGLDDFQAGRAPLLFPNPAQDQVTLRFVAPVAQVHQIKLVDQVGQTVYEGNLLPGDDQVQFDAQRLPSGLYYLLLSSEERQYPSRKLVIEH